MTTLSEIAVRVADVSFAIRWAKLEERKSLADQLRALADRTETAERD